MQNEVPILNKDKLTTKDLAVIGVFAAVICVLGPLSLPIPISPVPVTFAILAVYLSAYVLGMKRGTLCVLVYLLIGMAGLPVFSGFSGGLGKLAGPTGGYLAGYILIALSTGWFADRSGGRPVFAFIGMVIGTAVCYALGTLWLALSLGMTFLEALAIGVAPYVLLDVLKMLLASALGMKLRESVEKAGRKPLEEK